MTLNLNFIYIFISIPLLKITGCLLLLWTYTEVPAQRLLKKFTPYVITIHKIFNISLHFFSFSNHVVSTSCYRCGNFVIRTLIRIFGIIIFFSTNVSLNCFTIDKGTTHSFIQSE